MSETALSRISLSQPDLRFRLKREYTDFRYTKRNSGHVVKSIKNNGEIFLPEVKTVPSKSVREPINQEIKEYLDHSNSPIVRVFDQGKNNEFALSEVVIGSGFELEKSLFKSFKDKFFQYGVVALAVLLIGFGSYMSFVGWQSNNQVKKQATKLTAMANQLTGLGSVTPLTTASPNTPSNAPKLPSGVLSTVSPSVSSYHPFSASPLDPVRIVIPSIGVNSSVAPTGLTSSGALGVPYNVFYTAWYDQSAYPGQPGATLIDGHVSSWTSKGVFYYIKDLQPGDKIEVTNAAGTTFTYSVVRSQIFPSGNVNMTSTVTPVIAGQPGLNLITCTGDVIPGTSLFNERIVVYSSLSS